VNTNIIPIDHDLRGQLVWRLVNKHGMDSVTANAAIDDMLGYVHTIAHNPGCGYGPSDIVDMAWHEFILHTADYMAYCEMAYGRYIHHRPNRRGEVGKLVSETAAFMAANGIVYDPKLWGKADCEECGASDPPPGGCTSHYSDPILAFANATNKCSVDCDGGNDGGPSGCTGPGNCS